MFDWMAWTLPVAVFFTTIVLMLAVFTFNLLGDALRDIFDPRRRT